MLSFTTHKNKIVTGDALQTALNTVADQYRQLAIDIRKENLYADHVTEQTKEDNMRKMIAGSEEIIKGVIGSFAVWQRVNQALTGECVALLP